MITARERLAMLGDKADDLTRYQADAEEAIEREAREQRDARERSTESATIAQLRGEIIQLRAQAAARDQEFLNFVQSVTKGFDKIEAWVNKTVEARVLDSERQTAAKISETFAELRGELRGHLTAIDARGA
jgi:hypothetical protein